MINYVADEKSGRRDEGNDHARDMALPDVAPDPEPTYRNENGADGIEGRIDCGQVLDCHSDWAEIGEYAAGSGAAANRNARARSTTTTSVGAIDFAIVDPRRDR